MPDSKVINNPFLDDQNTNKVTEQSVSKFDPSTAKPVQNKSQVAEVDGFQFDPSTAKAVNKGFSGHARDLGASLMGGLAAVPDIAVGVADLYTGGRAGKAVDNLSDNFKLGQAQKYWQDQKTDQAKVQSQQFSDAEGIIDKTKVALSNPSMIANTVTESLPSMAVGGLAGRGINIASKGAIGAAASGAIGEGAVMAGSQAEQIRQKTDDGLLTGKQTAAALGTGVAGSLLGFLGGTVAKKLGFEDVDTLMARGVKPEQVAQEITQIPFSSIPKSVVLGAISEGLLEEMPQSVTEQVLQNYALDKDLFEGVDDAIVMGTLAGMAMGGTVAGTSQASKWAGQPNTENPASGDETDTTGSTPMLPAPTGGNGGTGLGFDGLQGEYIPAGAQASAQPTQARQNFEYDQMPTDAERQIEFGGLSRQYAPTPSEQMGLDPNLGPLSAAAATAVDNGVSQQMQIEMQAQAAAETTSNVAGKTEDSNAPLQQAADAARELTPEQIHGKLNTYGPEVTDAIEQLKQHQQGEQNAPITFDEGIQNGTAQQGNAPFNNGSQPVSEQHDTNTASAMGAATGAAQKGLQPAKADAGQIIPSNQSLNEIQTSEAKSKLPDIESKVTELEAQLVTEKSVPKKAQIRKQIAELQNELSTQAQSDVNLSSPQKATVENHRENFAKMDRSIAKINSARQRMREANPEIFTAQNDRVRETHGLTNARVTAIADEIESSGSYELSDREYDKVKNNPNYKIDYNPKTFIGKVTAVKDQHSGEWVGNTKKPAGDLKNNDDSTLTNEGTTQPPGKTEKVYTPGTNREIEVRHKVVEADSLITSNDANGAVNPNFPKHLQPRDRSRPTSIAQVHDIASKLNPKLLGENPSTASGAPIVSGNGVVESGNGRTMAIRKAYETGKGEAYKQWLSEQGYDVSGMKNPVLVRERTTAMTDQELQEYTRESNESTTLTMSPTEQAMVDAKAVVDILEQYRGGDINSAANRDFVNRFVTELVPTSERGKMLSAGTGLTQDGQRRINAALVAAAYNDTFIVDQVFESTESDIKAIGNALTDVAGFWAKMRDMAINGQIPKDLDITPNLVEAVHLVQKARVTSTKLADLVAQDDIFSGAVDPVTLDFLSIFYRGDKYTRARGRERVVDALNHYAQQAMQQFSVENLFGDKPKTNNQLRGETLDRLDQQETDKQQDIFASAKSDDTNFGTSSGTGQRAPIESADAKTQSEQSLNNLIQIQSDSGLTHRIPRKLIDRVHKLGSVVNDLASIKTEGVKTNVLYGKRLLAKIAKLNPDVQVHIISDLNRIKDKTARARLSSGGFYIPDQNILYIYPQTDLWEGSVLELINHELTHTVTEQSITTNQVSRENLDKLEQFRSILGEYIWNQGETLDENMAERLRYAYEQDFPHELLAVSTAESNVREVFKKMLGEDGFKQLNAIFTEISTNQFKEKQDDRLSPRGQSQQPSRDRAENLSTSDTGTTKSDGTTANSSDEITVSTADKSSGTQDGSKRSTQTDVRDGTDFDDRFKSVLEDSGRDSGKTLGRISEEDKQLKNNNEKKRFSRAENLAASSTVAQVREALVSRFGEKIIADLEAQGILNIIQDQQEGMTGNLEGWYENRKVTLVASNLDADSAVATFLHELGGHGGFQNMMNKDAYADLMHQFERMVEQGNPVAVEAKRLAERELNKDVQLDEYLPYMITLTSQMQLKNVVQKGAIKRFMDRVVSAVKAWLYDKGIKLNLNENDVLALAERMVAVQSKTSFVRSQNDDIRFSRSSNYSDITNRISNGLKNLPKTGEWINKKGVDWLGVGLGFLSRRHLTEVYSKLLPQLNKYNELAAQMDADKNDIAAEADNIVREWSKLKDEEALANVMHDATLAQIDPAKPYQQGDDKVKYQQLRHAYNKLSPEAQAMYKKARNAYSGHYAKVREAIRERILRSALSSQKKADLLKNIEGSFGQIKGVYFPLARFGRYVVVMRNKNGDVEVVSRAETMNEAEAMRDGLITKYPQFKADDVKKDAEFNASRDSVGRGFMSDLFDEVGNLGLDTKAQAEFEDTLSQLYLSSMPDLSWAKHGIHRKGTAGFSQDARRAFAQHMFSGANYLGKLRYGDQLAQQLDEMKKHSNEQFNKGIGYDQRSAQSVIDEMEKRHELLMNPKGNPLSSFLTSVGFMYYMGLSPAAAMVNLSQTALIAYPLMGAKWNYDKAGKELLKASRDFAKGVEFKVPDFSNMESFKNSIGDVYSPNIDKVIKGLELDAYNKAVKRGVIDVTQAHDLAGIAQGEDSKVMWYFRPAMRLASGMFHHAERFNREVTFIAAYRLASQAGASHTEAFDQAMDMVYRGHFDYSAGNRARFMQGNIAKVVLLFKQYAQNMLYTLLRNAHQSIYALDPKDQREARRALAGILGMHALAAGAIGLPITGMLATASILIAKKSKLGAAAFGIAAMAALASGGGDDDPYELENVIRNWLADIHPIFADLVFGGVPRVLSPVDLSGRVGLNNLIIPDVQDGIEGADWSNAYAAALLGPVAGIGTNMAKGMQLMGEGHYARGLENILPIVLRNPLKAVRYADEGVLAKDGKVIQEDVGGVGIFSQAIGFSPSDVRTSMEGRSAIYAYKNKLNNGRNNLMDAWVNARREDDSDGMEEAWAAILEFNEKVSEKNPNMRINRIQLMRRYKERERKNNDAGDGGVYLTKRERGAEEQGNFAFNQ